VIAKPEVGPVERELAEHIERLRADGWAVVREPASPLVPPSLRDLRVDFIANRDAEVLILEVAHRRTSRRERIDAIAKRVANIPNARLEVYWIGDTSIVKPNPENVRHYISAAEAVSEVSLQAALLMALAAFEGAVATFADEVGIKPQVPARQLLANLYSLGFVEGADYHRLSALYTLRAEIAHSVTPQVPAPDDIRFGLDLASRMLEGRYVSADQLIEWFKEHYEAPERNAISEGGYLYTANEPVTTDGVLRDKFPDATEQALVEAVRWLRNESFAWVRKPGYLSVEYERPVPGGRLRRPNAVSTLVDARRLPEGVTLTFVMRGQREREWVGPWLADDDRRSQATWVNTRSKPLLWAYDGQRYSPSGLVTKIWELSGWPDHPVSVQGPSQWVVPGKGTLWEMAKVIQDEGETGDED
jgi:hypothetical protein